MIERVQTDIAGLQAENEGDIPNNQLTQILNRYFIEVPSELLEETKLIAKEGGYEITWSEIYNKNIVGEPVTPPTFNPDTLEIGTSAKNTDKYGWKVKEYQVEKNETGCWRLFYQDTNYTYLISDNCIGDYCPSDMYTTVRDEKGELKYKTGKDVSTIGQKLNPTISSLFIESNETETIRATAWLTDTSDSSMWSKYKNADAVFAIGSPTAELFSASYNTMEEKEGIIEFTFDATSGDAGYRRKMDSDWLKTSHNYGIYNKSSNENWWLASPYAYSANGCLQVQGDSGRVNGSYCFSNAAVRPIVCIQTATFNRNYTLIEN